MWTTKPWSKLSPNSSRNHPNEADSQIGKAVLDWDTWTDDPAQMTGRRQ